MNTIKTKVSGIEVLIQVEDGVKKAPSAKSKIAGKSGIVEKSADETFADKALEKAAKVMLKLAEGFVKQFKSKENSPNEMEIEYSLSLDAKTSLWVITMGTTSNIKVKMRWTN